MPCYSVVGRRHIDCVNPGRLNPVVGFVSRDLAVHVNANHLNPDYIYIFCCVTVYLGSCGGGTSNTPLHFVYMHVL